MPHTLVVPVSLLPLVEQTVLDALAYPDPETLAQADTGTNQAPPRSGGSGPLSSPPQERIRALLQAPLTVGCRDEADFVGFGTIQHLGRTRPCCWHVVLHRDPDGTAWTHLYRVQHEHGAHRVVLLEQVRPGDRRAVFRLELQLLARDLCQTPSDPRPGLRG